MVDEHSKIVTIVWKQLGNRTVVTYADGGSDTMRANHLVAAAMARDAGLIFVPSRGGMTQWVKDADSEDESSED
jgi:hypothetical protein